MPKAHHDAEILDGIPAGVWADAWASYQENEKGESFSGMDIMDVAPKPPKSAKEWAKKAADRIVELNENAPLEDLYDIASREYGYKGDKEQFGFDLGMQIVGHGISWTDRADYKLLQSFNGRDLIKLPHGEFYYAGGRTIDGWVR